MFNARIAYYMFRRAGVIIGIFSLIVASFAIIGFFIWSSFWLGRALFGDNIIGHLFGMVPIIIISVILGAYPFALSDYKDEIKKQERIENRLRE